MMCLIYTYALKWNKWTMQGRLVENHPHVRSLETNRITREMPHTYDPHVGREAKFDATRIVTSCTVFFSFQEEKVTFFILLGMVKLLQSSRVTGTKRRPAVPRESYCYSLELDDGSRRSERQCQGLSRRRETTILLS